MGSLEMCNTDGGSVAASVRNGSKHTISMDAVRETASDV